MEEQNKKTDCEHCGKKDCAECVEKGGKTFCCEHCCKAFEATEKKESPTSPVNVCKFC